MSHSFENRLRWVTEGGIAGLCGLTALCLGLHPTVFGLAGSQTLPVLTAFAGLGLWRGYEAVMLKRYHFNLVRQRPFSMSTREVPLSKRYLYLGQGFEFKAIHRQRLHLLEAPENAQFLQKNILCRLLNQSQKNHEKPWKQALQRLPFLRPLPEIGTKAHIHGVGIESERKVFVPHSERHGHMLVLGTTRVGKTRLLCILVNQDIRGGEAVLVIDPKGDLELLQDMYESAKAVGRINDFIALHVGCPEFSARYNTLKNFNDIADIADRVTSAMEAEGEGKQFQDFAWQFLNTTALCLSDLNYPINYKTLAFFVSRPKTLYQELVTKRLRQWYPDLETEIERLQQLNAREIKRGKETEIVMPSRTQIMKLMVDERMEQMIEKQDVDGLNDDPLFSLMNIVALKPDYYQKISASIVPLLDKINKTTAKDIFSWTNAEGLPEIDLERAVKDKKIIYIGLDSLTNPAMSQAVGKAIISDLVSLAGRLQMDSAHKKKIFNCYFDELSEIMPDNFIQLVNKAGGAGFRVTGLTQTLNDLILNSNNRDLAMAVLGNFGTKICLRIANADTAKIFTETLEEVPVRHLTPTSKVTDRAHEDDSDLFQTENADTVSELRVRLVHENDLTALMKGQAFVTTNGGQLYKIRMPLPKVDGQPPETLEDMLMAVNYG